MYIVQVHCICYMSNSELCPTVKHADTCSVHVVKRGSVTGSAGQCSECHRRDSHTRTGTLVDVNQVLLNTLAMVDSE